MADYVRKTILSQGYAHIQRKSLTPEEKTEFELALRTYQESRAKLMMSSSIVPEVKTKDGSVKVYATVYGSLTDAIGDLSDGFMSALNALYVSSKMLADACVLEGLFLSKAPRKSLTRSEARTGVVKTTKDLFDMTSAAANSFSDDGSKKIMGALLNIENKATFLNVQLDDPRDKRLVWSNFLVALAKLPKKPTKLNASEDKSRLDAYTFKVETIVKLVQNFVKQVEGQ
ncbi:hypothetical protein [Burkholderia sp. MSMB2157WGS]|uniref:hypothetical protein n=1 Tax=Burkholderia sp. MSMB2157WGS TaxID=1637928 RepID=UPI000A59B76C|nr:hypothetical protein [Burkholderia sp. MSMB2157WGS]